jgi:hypothetical protein
VTSDTAAFRIRDRGSGAPRSSRADRHGGRRQLDLLDPPWRWTLKGLVVILALA